MFIQGAKRARTTRDINIVFMSNYTFEQLPGIVAMLADEIKALREQLQQKDVAPRQSEDGMMDLKGLQDFHPEHPAAATKEHRKGQEQCPQGIV